MKQRAMKIGAVTSLLFVGVVVILWIRSFAGHGDKVSFATARGLEISLISYRGGFVYDLEILHPRYPTELGAAIAVRYAFLVLIGLLLPAWRWGRGRPQGRAGFCPRCGYDLRATPARCPECGTEPSAPVPAEAARLIDCRMWVVGAFGLLCLVVGWVGQPVLPDVASDAFLFAIVLGVSLAILILIRISGTQGGRQKRMNSRGN
jgi:hypothetical protein